MTPELEPESLVKEMMKEFDGLDLELSTKSLMGDVLRLILQHLKDGEIVDLVPIDEYTVLQLKPSYERFLQEGK